MKIAAPKPPNFSAMADSWNDPEAFAAHVAQYYAELGVRAAADARDITVPIRDREGTA